MVLRKLFGSLSFFFVKLVIYLRDFYSMRKIYTTVSFLLCFAWALLGGPELTSALAQSDCGINVTSFNVLPSEVIKEGVKYKRVQVVVNNPQPGLFKKFYFLFDDSERDTSTASYSYGLNTDEFLVPIDVEVITFFDFNNDACKVVFSPDFAENKCPINVSTYIDLSAGDCYNRTVTFTVQDGFTVDSVVWLKNGSRVSVHDEMRWVNIPPGDYEIFFYNDEGCEATSKLSTCISSTEAGEDRSIVYCIGEEDTVNLYDLLSPGVDPGSFFAEDYSAVDSISATRLTYDAVSTNIYYYTAPASLEIPDTSIFTIDARDCSVCAYELISANRHCSDPESIEVTIGGGTTEDTTFRVTLPDGTVETRTFFSSFQVDFSSFSDTLFLALQTNTPTGTCDSIIQIAPISSPSIQINATEVLIPGEDSVGIEVSVNLGTAPYELDVFVGDSQKFVQLAEGESQQLDFIQSADTAYLIASDAAGCMGSDTLYLTPDCIMPDATTVQPVCGVGGGQISVDRSALRAGSQITWTDTSAVDLWERSGLPPDTYHYTVTYDHCQVTGAVTIEEGLKDFPEVFLYDECPIDGQVQIYIRDSAQVRQWSVGGTALTYFTGFFPANQDIIFELETLGGCTDTTMIRGKEDPWLDQIGFQEPNRLSARLALDPESLTDYGWRFRDSILCDNCEDYQGDDMLKPGSYVFFIEQFAGCSKDTMLVIDEPEYAFTMPNVITPGSGRNRLLQIFDPLNQMVSIIEFQVYDRFGNVLFEKYDFQPDDDASINWPNGTTTELPNIVVCIAKIKCKEGDEVTMAQDVLILR